MSSDVFRRGSRTFFCSSFFFPRKVWRDVCALYAFVRTVDDFVDVVPQQVDAFFSFRDDYEKVMNGGCVDNRIISSFVELQRRRRFERVWVDDFFDAMECDVHKGVYESLADLIEYMQGSAETVGLMMARVMDVPERSWSSACALGRALQYANFIRDIAEDNALGRVYFPQEELREYRLRSLDREESHRFPARFGLFMTNQIKRYGVWRREAEEGFSFLPHKYKIPVQTAAHMYDWTVEQIAKNPFVVFEKKVRPSVVRIVGTGVWNAVR